MLTALALALSVSCSAAPPPGDPWLESVDRRLLSFRMKDAKTMLISKEVSFELGSMSWDDRIDDVFRDVPEALATYQKARAAHHRFVVMEITSIAAVLVGGGVTIGAIFVGATTTAFVMLAVGGVLDIVSVVLAIVGSLAQLEATAGLLEAVDQFNHGLLRPPGDAPAMPPPGVMREPSGPLPSLVLATF